MGVRGLFEEKMRLLSLGSAAILYFSAYIQKLHFCFASSTHLESDWKKNRLVFLAEMILAASF